MNVMTKVAIGAGAAVVAGGITGALAHRSVSDGKHDAFDRDVTMAKFSVVGLLTGLGGMGVIAVNSYGSGAARSILPGAIGIGLGVGAITGAILGSQLGWKPPVG